MAVRAELGFNTWVCWKTHEVSTKRKQKNMFMMTKLSGCR